jgi:hypothetical protein
MVTLVPPALGPLAGEIEVTAGCPAAARKVNWLAELAALVPLGVVTATFTVPVPAGATAEIEVELLTVNEVAAVAPNFTAVTPVKLVPVMVTLVPPVAKPLFGDTAVTVGAGI